MTKKFYMTERIFLFRILAKKKYELFEFYWKIEFYNIWKDQFSFDSQLQKLL